MAKPYPPQEVTQVEQRTAGFKHVSVFLAQAFEQQATEQAKGAAADQAPPGAEADRKQQ
ncbi:hypothetical protein GJ698_15005 [Pseudoduganella sp. FT26W]|uniref:Uncharacterized protein n=1 Tax=Duganella aquatilis TaxID=2666082 RepID=A0A844CY84_9BURK|nr:hypothetical protein [Duganella aquatilis]MRW85393.1 hypothetical protein [Duganella aquatilis]